jgi:arabinose-5-phosphate isomerase
MKKHKILSDAKKVIQTERKAIAALEKKLDESLVRAVEMIYKCKGRVVVTGIGKSGIIAQKIVATLNSTGTPSLFLHSADSVHGDLGMIKEGDVVICVSKSGDNEELIKLLKVLKNFNISVISITGDVDSQLNGYSDVVLDASVDKEACPYNLAPTSSTTASLVLGDALAITLLKLKDFTKEEFAMLHPGGVLGKKLLLRVNDLMVTGKNVPVVYENTSFKDLVFEITSKRLGCTCVIDKHKKLKGIITDGDIRRLLQNHDNISQIKAKDFMNDNPKIINERMLGETALELMEKYSITQLVIVDKKKKPVGIVHMHDLVKAGLG